MTDTSTVETTNEISSKVNKDTNLVQEDSAKETPVTEDTEKVAIEEEDEFTDAVGESHEEEEEDDDDEEEEEEGGGLQEGDALGLSMVISALQGTVQQQQQQQQQQQKEVQVTREEDSESKPDDNGKQELTIDVNTSATASTGDDTSEPSTPVPGDISSDTPSNKKPELTLQTDLLRKSLELPADKNMADYVTPPTPGVAPTTSTELPKELQQDQEYSQTNTIVPGKIDLKSVSANTLGPREQEKYDQNMLKGMQAFFNNKFADAKSIFSTRSENDPLYALGLGCMAFIKAISSSDPKDAENAILTLTETYQFANAQIEAASAKKPLKDTVSHYITNLMGTNPTNLPTNTRPLNQDEMNNQPTFISNGALRAHVIKAECGLLMGIIHLTQETVVGYLKMGMNLRRAYSSYSLVWQEYKRMGQDFQKYLDQDTISAIQFGIGSVHLLLSSLPPKILRIVSAFGWKADKHLGFALLKLCLEGRRIRSPLASMMLLSYYVILTSFAPQLLTQELVQPAIECLLDAQQTYPNSAFFLYFAGRVSRLAKNLSLSTQSFVYTYEVSQGAWAETTMGHLATFEIAFNCAMALDWASASERLLELQNKHHSPAFVKYFYGACAEMMGNRTEAILAFAEAPKLLMDKKKKSQMEHYVTRKVEFFEQSGYQDMDFSLPALEILAMWNCFPTMSEQALEQCLVLIDTTLEAIYEREKQEYEIRVIELAPNAPVPDYYDQRGTLLVIKSSILNSLNRPRDAIVHLNWVIDHKDHVKYSKWIVPFAYWESGITLWALEDFKRARALWEQALSFSGYDFEYRLAIRLNLAITHAIELGVPETPPTKPEKGLTTHGRKRMSIINRLTSSSSTPMTPVSPNPLST
ncbi:uncharacterized protein BX664DRAFT_336077 [Halteromyces radiatus]|uniref:uncharacterized protein n=1 Tax=Halteromyces radiatus TaxID=101107 RepID=UPI00221F38ED|nr:uncharacterized protein BX664DRAFT_336077 [Halteromyces radiatus]KAI8086532.1 hypothetical protein BX664DRAFT_336077 [Halteromyces radiatus]